MISEDENAERLAIKYGAHVVISSSSLQCLIDNNGPLFQRQWEMPVIVKDHVLTEGKYYSFFRVSIYQCLTPLIVGTY